MTGDCQVRFCERLRGETPLCLLGEKPGNKFKINSISFGTKLTNQYSQINELTNHESRINESRINKFNFLSSASDIAP